MKTGVFTPAEGTRKSFRKSETAAAFERECEELFVDVVTVFGAPRSVGQIYGVLFASQQPLSFTDIVERLEISKGSASQGLKLLRSLGAIRPASIENDRREYFVAELGLRRLVDGALRERIAPLVTTASSRIDRLRKLARTGVPPTPFLSDQVEQLEIWRRRLKVALPLLSAFLGSSGKRSLS